MGGASTVTKSNGDNIPNIEDKKGEGGGAGELHREKIQLGVRRQGKIVWGGRTKSLARERREHD